MKHIFVYLTLISFLFLASSCPKQDNKPYQSPPEVLPPATQTGANTFGCLVNGKVWLPMGPAGMIILDAQYYRGLFLLSGSKDSNYKVNGGQFLSMSYQGIYRPGTYYFKEAPLGAGPPLAEFMDFIVNCDYKTNDQDSLQTFVTITKLDSINRIVSGTFNFLFVPPRSGCDTIKITQGRFDMKYEF